jgi:hypothetical protein
MTVQPFASTEAQDTALAAIGAEQVGDQTVDILKQIFVAASAGAANSGPAENAVAVAPGASALSSTTRAIFVGTGGDMEVTMSGGGNVTFTNIPSGTTLPIRVTHVLATGTDATDIVALW